LGRLNCRCVGWRASRPATPPAPAPASRTCIAHRAPAGASPALPGARGGGETPGMPTWGGACLLFAVRPLQLNSASPLRLAWATSCAHFGAAHQEWALGATSNRLLAIPFFKPFAFGFAFFALAFSSPAVRPGESRAALRSSATTHIASTFAS
jgi:hypothetical protein